MSVRIYASVALPQGARSNPATLAEAFGAAFSALDKKAAERKLRPIWDTLESHVESEQVDALSFFDEHTRITTGEVSVLAIDPEEVDA